MSCKNCKEKKDLYNELYEQTEGVPTFVIWIVITLVVFAWAVRGYDFGLFRGYSGL